jgi:hypothetical protein
MFLLSVYNAPNTSCLPLITHLTRKADGLSARARLLIGQKHTADNADAAAAWRKCGSLSEVIGGQQCDRRALRRAELVRFSLSRESLTEIPLPRMT